MAEGECLGRGEVELGAGWAVSKFSEESDKWAIGSHLADPELLASVSPTPGHNR